METFTMSGKELPRPGLVQAALAGRITNREAAAALHMTARQVQRLKQRFRLEGAGGLRHRTRGQPSPRRLSVTVTTQVQAFIRDRYAGFNDTHLTEKLRELHGLAVSRESVRRLRQALGLGAVHRRRPPQHRARRLREAAAGQLVQLDGSPFAWLEDRAPTMTLLGAIDDATSTVVGLHFRPTEDLHGYVTLLHQVFTTVGLPVALYGDGVGILVRSDRHWSLQEQLAGERNPTHAGRMLKDLGIAYVQARSPQGKGRVERLWGTLQDRLVSELRLRRIATRAAANAFLPDFIADFNRRFARAARDARAVWRPPPRDLALVLGCHYTRVVARDNTVRLGDRLIQLPPGRGHGSYARRRADVRELLDGRLVVLIDHRVVVSVAAPEDFILAPRAQPNRSRPPLSVPQPPPLRRALAALAASVPRPRHPHPWRFGYDPRRAVQAGYHLPKG
jgi:transposase